jgi:hypothetical protein
MDRTAHPQLHQPQIGCRRCSLILIQIQTTTGNGTVMQRYQDFRYRLRGELALRTAGPHACRGKAPCPDGQRHRRAIQRRGIWSLIPRKPGALSCAAIEQMRVESTRAACRIVHIRRRIRASNFAVPGKTGVALPRTVPGAAFRDSRRVRGTHGIGLRQRERFASHHSSKVNSVCAPTLGLAAPFFVPPRRRAT